MEKNKDLSQAHKVEYELIAKTFMGLEPVLAKELTQLGANNVQIGRRMVSFTYGSGDDLKYIGNIGTATFTSAMDVDVAGMSLNLFGDSTAAATAWTGAAVPEPTSGLLLLLGMAGLALKRKRA